MANKFLSLGVFTEAIRKLTTKIDGTFLKKSDSIIINCNEAETSSTTSNDSTSQVITGRIKNRINTSANWESANPILYKGEIGIAIITDTDNNVSNKIKIGDGVTHWNDLKFITGDGNGAGCVFVIYNDTTKPQEAWQSITTKTPSDGQILVIKTPSGDIQGYVWSTTNSAWYVFSGSVNADNVMFDEDIICAGDYSQVGNISKSKNGITTISANGKSLTDVMKSIFTLELQPTITQPSVSITINSTKTYEVGTIVSPTYTASFNSGSYQYDSSTGVTVTSWEVTDSNGNTSSASSGTFNSFTVTDTTNYKITAKANYSDGNYAKTNLGKNTTLKIVSGNQSKTSDSITGYRSFFYGAVTTDSSTPLTSNIIRSLTNGGSYNGTKELTINPIANAKRYIVAIPSASTRLGLTSAKLPNSLNAEVKSLYLTSTVQVEGQNGHTAVNYKVYTYEPASIASNEIHKITLS